jgi:hypothetical protein
VGASSTERLRHIKEQIHTDNQIYYIITRLSNLDVIQSRPRTLATNKIHGIMDMKDTPGLFAILVTIDRLEDLHLAVVDSPSIRPRHLVTTIWIFCIVIIFLDQFTHQILVISRDTG